MATEAEEIQTKEFLKRAEIRTMRKDLLSLREADSLKERDKIAKIKTLEEQMQEQAERIAKKEEANAQAEKADIEKVLGKNAEQEREAEKDIKEYATEQERQQIFLLESQRLGFEKQTEIINREKDPALKLEKNQALLLQQNQEKKLQSVLEQEKKLQDEEKFIEEKANASAVASEKKSLEQRRWEIEDQVKEEEKKRWEVEKQLESVKNKIAQTDKSSEQLVAERNELRQKILGADKALREIYSSVIAREEEKRRGRTEEQKTTREAAAKIKGEEKERIQRQHWTMSQEQTSGKIQFESIPVPVKRPVTKESLSQEEEQRRRFMQSVEEGIKNN